MRVTRLRLCSFRNFTREEISFGPGVNLLVGPNGQGKTNLLEAIYFLGYGRSFRTAAPRECIRHSEEQAWVGGSVEHGAIVRDLEIAISSAEKRLTVRGKEVSLEEFVGSLHVLALTSRHLGVVRGGPDERRAFLDRAMLTLYPGHIRHLALYSRTLKQRNRLLRLARVRGGRLDQAALESWDEQLVSEGARIAANRRRYVAEMKRELTEPLFAGERLEVEYVSSAAAGGEIEEIEREFGQRLVERRAADLRLGFTSVGPHRDELRLTLDGRSLADYGSAGQQRSALVALYFAQMEVHRAYHGHFPVFLLDDVEAELDAARLESLLDYLTGRTQTFLTAARESFVPAGGRPIERYEILAGTARRAAGTP